ncbi:Rieske 2Fe-2S domain-containing protein [Lysinibacter sp. HNR]|uniref:cytochrome bc1 complex Rieske iron-sulfur subunit n=1 Tax=Lysinibacter sp. HNR TaxID=3031408 RepID=UPI00243586B4|nr:Rieske 2Fe-2S domain-containing protein [Lysinibacter sp. HNR]WGD36231.1 Rieske 2Fe-2S domain-containing protein [Lysinibacter sp. HNR]
MAQDVQNSDSNAVVAASAADHAETESAGTAVIPADAIPNPGFPPHRKRVTDTDPKKEKRAVRTVYTLFWLSIIGSIGAIASYMAFPIESGDREMLRLNTLFMGLGMTLSLFGIGLAAIHWGKSLMVDSEGIDERHPVRGDDETRTEAAHIFQQANAESGFGRRSLIRNSLIGALVAFPLPGIVILRSLAPQDQDPVALLKETMWDNGVRLTIDPSGRPIKASEVTIGSVFHVIPDGLNDLEHKLDEKAKSIVLLMRLNPDQLIEDENRKGWSYDGIVAYSKVCTHVGCPVALYEQHTHHLLCPCHQSQFDVTRHCEVIFGPAKRPLPQLPITVDDEGYLIAQSDFTEPVGPSFWERVS